MPISHQTVCRGQGSCACSSCPSELLTTCTQTRISHAHTDGEKLTRVRNRPAAEPREVGCWEFPRLSGEHLKNTGPSKTTLQP